MSERASEAPMTAGERASAMPSPSPSRIAWWIVTRWVVQLLFIATVVDAMATHFFKLEAMHFCMMAITMNFLVLGMCNTRDALLTRSFDESQKCSLRVYFAKCAIAVLALTAMSGGWIIAAARRPGGEPLAMLAGAVLVLTLVLLIQQFARDWARDVVAKT